MDYKQNQIEMAIKELKKLFGNFGFPLISVWHCLEVLYDNAYEDGAETGTERGKNA